MRGSASRAVFWVLAARQGERLLGIVSIALLARLLSPSDFGLVAMAGSIVAIVEVFSAFGFDWAIVRMSNPTREHYDTAWTLRLLCGAAIFVVLTIVAYPAAVLLKQPSVAPIVFVLGINSLIGSTENIWMAEYRRQRIFEPEFKLRVSTKIVGFIVSIGVALTTRSYWSLVIGVSAARIAASLMSYHLHPSRPRWTLLRREELMGFSIWLLIGSVTDAMRNRFAELWLGRNLGTKNVGFFSLASELSTLATTELAAPINRAVFTNYAAHANNLSELRVQYLRVSGLLWLIGIPAAAGIGVCSSQIVAILLGAQWMEAAQVLQILALAGLLSIVSANTHYVYWALGRSRFVTSLSIIEATGFILLTILFGSKYGLMGVAWSQVMASFLVVVINMFVLFRTLNMRLGDIVSRGSRIVAASGVMIACVVGTSYWFAHVPSQISSLWQFLVMALVGVVSYAASLFYFWNLSGRPNGSEREVIDLIFRNLNHVLERWKAA